MANPLAEFGAVPVQPSAQQQATSSLLAEFGAVPVPPAVPLQEFGAVPVQQTPPVLEQPTAPSQAPGILQALGGAPAPVSNDLGAAFASGIRNETISGLLGQAVGLIPNTPQEMAAVAASRADVQYDFQPDTTAEKIAQFAGGLIDPVGGFGAAKVGQAALKSVGLLNKAERSRKLATLAGAAEAGSAGVVFGAGQQALKQVNSGEFDPTAIALGGAIGGVGGSALGAVGGRLKFNFKEKADKAKKALAEAYEQNDEFSKTLDTLPLTQGTEGKFGDEFAAAVSKNKKEAVAINNQISVLESAREELLNRVATAASPEEAASLQLAAANKALEAAPLHQKFVDKFGDESYNQLMTLKRAYANTKIKIDGKQVPAFNYALGKKGIVIDPETAIAVNKIKDPATLVNSGRLFGGGVGAKDPIRALQDVEGMAGPVQRLVLGGIGAGDLARQQEGAKIANEFEALAKAAGIKRNSWTDWLTPAGRQSREASTKVFDFIEGKVSKAELAPSEQKLASYVKVTYENLLNRINQVRVANNLTPIKRRENYITHLQDISLAERFGLDTAGASGNPIPKNLAKIKFSFEKARTGNQSNKDVYEAVSSYANSAMRTIHLTQPRNQALALTELMDNAPNLRNGLVKYLNGPIFGGAAPIDKFFIESGLEVVPRTLSEFSRIFGRGTLLGNLNVAAQQASQTLPTAAIAGPINTLEALNLMTTGLPKEIKGLSKVLAQRLIPDEAGIRAGQSGRGFAGQAVSQVERGYRKTMEFLDEKVAEHTWAAGFLQAKRNYQLSDKAAARYADDVTRSLHGIYRDVYRPLFLQNKVVKGALPFSTFGYNLWNNLVSDTAARAKLTGSSQFNEVAKMVATMELTNYVYEMVGAPKPFDLGAADPLNYSKEKGFVGRSALPSIGPLSAVGGPAFTQKAAEARAIMKNAYDLAFNENVDPDVAKETLTKNAVKFGKNFVPGGQQLYNTVRGIQATRRGYAEIGKEEIPLASQDVIPAALFGPQNTPSVIRSRRQ